MSANSQMNYDLFWQLTSKLIPFDSKLVGGLKVYVLCDDGIVSFGRSNIDRINSSLPMHLKITEVSGACSLPTSNYDIIILGGKIEVGLAYATKYGALSISDNRAGLRANLNIFTEQNKTSIYINRDRERLESQEWDDAIFKIARGF